MENSSFVQVMKDWHRMCKAMTDRKPNNACDGCPLEPYGCSPVYEAIDSYRDIDFEVVGETIMAWAAEHPAPKYPTWMEYLFTMYDTVWPQIATMEIPADIAQKLGIEPKEDT